MKKLSLFLMLLVATATTLTSCTSETLTGEGPEGLGGEAGESGIQWNINQVADETRSGLRLILSYDPATLTFSGTLENLNTNVVPMTRIEVHVIDAAGVSTEFGPTPPVDMQPGETRNVSLQISQGLNSVKYTIHAEFGTPGSGN